jgi:hypothetical protein
MQAGRILPCTQPFEAAVGENVLIKADQYKCWPRRTLISESELPIVLGAGTGVDPTLCGTLAAWYAISLFRLSHNSTGAGRRELSEEALRREVTIERGKNPVHALSCRCAACIYTGEISMAVGCIATVCAGCRNKC